MSSSEKENDMNISNSELSTDEKISETVKQKIGDEVVIEQNPDVISDVEQGTTNDAEQSYVMSDEDEDDESDNDEDDSPDCPEIQKLVSNDETMSELMSLYSRELYLVDETPEERKEIDENPDRPVLTMRNTSSKFFRLLFWCNARNHL